MSIPDPSQLLRELAGGRDLDAAATAAGFEQTQAAAQALEQLAVELSRAGVEGNAAAGGSRPKKSRRGSTVTLPGDPPAKSPFPKGQKGIAQADGASRGNPGPAAYGCVFLSEDGTALCGEGETIGRATNNVAEYRGAIAALTRLRDWGLREVVVRLDSQLVVRQLQGSYKVKSAGLKSLHAQASALVDHFDRVALEYIPRAENALADAFANRALDQAKS